MAINNPVVRSGHNVRSGLKVRSGLYQHYKGPYYRVIEVARHSESEEDLVIYQALYGEKGIWARPISMFVEEVSVGNELQARFAYCEDQSCVLEVATLEIKPELENDFECAFDKAQAILVNMNGYMSHELQHCVENQSRYILFVKWQTIEDHTVGFRNSAEYLQWKSLLYHLYARLPVVEHYATNIAL